MYSDRLEADEEAGEPDDQVRDIMIEASNVEQNQEHVLSPYNNGASEDGRSPKPCMPACLEAMFLRLCPCNPKFFEHAFVFCCCAGLAKTGSRLHEYGQMSLNALESRAVFRDQALFTSILTNGMIVSFGQLGLILCRRPCHPDTHNNCEMSPRGNRSGATETPSLAFGFCIYGPLALSYWAHGLLSNLGLMFTSFRVYGFLSASILILLIPMGKLLNKGTDFTSTHPWWSYIQLITVTILALWYNRFMHPTDLYSTNEPGYAVIGTILVSLAFLCYAFGLQWSKRMFEKYNGSGNRSLPRISVWHMMRGVGALCLFFGLGRVLISGHMRDFASFLSDSNVAPFGWSVALGGALERFAALLAIQIIGPVAWAMTRFLFFNLGPEKSIPGVSVGSGIIPVWTSLWVAVWLWIVISEFFRYRRDHLRQVAEPTHRTLETVEDLEMTKTEMTTYKDDDDEEKESNNNIEHG